MNEVLSGVKSVATPKGIGMAIGLLIFLAAVKAFFPQYSDDALAAKYGPK